MTDATVEYIRALTVHSQTRTSNRLSNQSLRRKGRIGKEVSTTCIAAQLATRSSIMMRRYCPPPSIKPSRAHPIPLAIAIILVQDRMTALQSPLAFLSAAIAAAKKTRATASLDKSRILIKIDTRALDSNVPNDVDVEVLEGLLRRRKESSLLNISFNSWKTGELDNRPDVEDDRN